MRISLALLLLPFAAIASAQPTPAIHYPDTARGNVVEEQFGERVADPYRWLENDVRRDEQVRAWVTAQNQVTQAFLATLPARAAFRARMTQMYDYERFGIPEVKGASLFLHRCRSCRGRRAGGHHRISCRRKLAPTNGADTPRVARGAQPAGQRLLLRRFRRTNLCWRAEREGSDAISPARVGRGRRRKLQSWRSVYHRSDEGRGA